MLCCPGLVGRGARFASCGSARLSQWNIPPWWQRAARPLSVCPGEHSSLVGESCQATLSAPGLSCRYQLSQSPAGSADSREQTQDVCGLTEASRACACRQMSGKDAGGWSSSLPGRAVTSTAGSTAGSARCAAGWGRARGGAAVSSSRSAAQPLCPAQCAGSAGLSVCPGSTEQGKLPALPSGSCWPLWLPTSPWKLKSRCYPGNAVPFLKG